MGDMNERRNPRLGADIGGKKERERDPEDDRVYGKGVRR